MQMIPTPVVAAKWKVDIPKGGDFKEWCPKTVQQNIIYVEGVNSGQV